MHVMEITGEQYERIQDCLPVQRGNVRHDNLVLLNAILYVAEHGCKWRGLPKRYGNWDRLYVRMIVGPRRACWIRYSPSCSRSKFCASQSKLSVWTRPR